MGRIASPEKWIVSDDRDDFTGQVESYEPMMSFGEDAADIYDDTPRGEEEETTAFLLQLARGGPALELAIGTGRVALPLANRGVRVDGIDLS